VGRQPGRNAVATARLVYLGLEVRAILLVLVVGVVEKTQMIKILSGWVFALIRLERVGVSFLQPSFCTFSSPKQLPLLKPVYITHFNMEKDRF